MSESGKVSRRLTLKIEPMRGGKFSLTTSDATTRSVESGRDVKAHIAADMFESEAALKEGFGMILDSFSTSLEKEDQGALFADEKGPKPKLDKR